MTDFSEIRSILKEHVVLFDQLNEFEDGKLESIAANDIFALEEQMKDEQVFLMKLKGLDQKRDRLLQKMGLTGKTFKEIISMAEGSERSDLEMVFQDLSIKTNVLQSTVSSSKDYIDIHLHSLKTLLSQLEMEAGKSGGQPLQRFPNKNA